MKISKKVLLVGLLGLTFGISACDKKEKAEPTPAEETTTAETKEGAATKAGDETAEKQDEKAEEKVEEVAKAAVGQPAPSFKLKDTEGNEHDLTALKGKIIVLEWTRPACPYVKRHYEQKTMMTTSEALGDEVVWMAIDSSKDVKVEDTKKWKEEHGFKHPVLLDPEGKVGKMYGAKTTPHMYVIDKEGKLAYTGAIDNDPNGKKDGQTLTNYVKEAVNALKEGKEVAKSQTEPYGCSVKYGS